MLTIYTYKRTDANVPADGTLLPELCTFRPTRGRFSCYSSRSSMKSHRYDLLFIFVQIQY